MTLFNLSDKYGNLFFKYRGQIPIILFLFYFPFQYFLGDIAFHTYFKTYGYISFFFVILGLYIRFNVIGYTTRGTSGRNRDKQIAESLNTQGMYSIVRNPLYLGNLLIWIGLLLYSNNIPFFIFSVIFFLFFYFNIIKVEEIYLTEKFREVYINWQNKTPRLFPNLTKYKRPKTKFSYISIIRREYPGVLSIILSYTYLEFIINFLKYPTNNFQEIILVLDQKIMTSLFAILIITFLIKLLKKYTNTLYEDNRS